MPKVKILFITSNDGSDTRLNKEVKTLSRFYDIYFIGVGRDKGNSYLKEHCKGFYLIDEKRNSVRCIIRQISLFRKTVKENNISLIHIVNEQLMIFFIPWLYRKKVVLDLFDSIFLKMNKPGNKFLIMKKIVYSFANKIIVTDERRLSLMPDFVNNKTVVIPNYPYLDQKDSVEKQNHDRIKVFFGGSVAETRGVNFVRELLEFEIIDIFLAGWIQDECSRELLDHPKVKYLGVLHQEDVNEFVRREMDFIMCMYEPSNENNINASPNKVYDAIQTETPVIINREVKVSDFVEKYNLGIILPKYNTEPDAGLIKTMKGFSLRKNEIIPLKKKYSWESLEKKLTNLYETNHTIL